MPEDCPLCDPEKKTEWHYEDDVVRVINCDTCYTPMMVLRRHTMKPTLEELRHATRVVGKLFGPDIDCIRTFQRDIEDHMHWHIFLNE